MKRVICMPWLKASVLHSCSRIYLTAIDAQWYVYQITARLNINLEISKANRRPAQLDGPNTTITTPAGGKYSIGADMFVTVYISLIAVALTIYMFEQYSYY